MAAEPDDPPGRVQPISVEQIGKLGINHRNELFWDGRRLVTRSQFALTVPQTLLAILAAIASLATIATGLNNASVFLCARDVRWLGCPTAPPPVQPP